jgi:hypothetical protein
METLILLPLLIQALILIGLFAALIYVIAVQIEKRKNETFEDRDN